MYDELQAHNRRTTWVLLGGSVALVAVMVLLFVAWMGVPVSEPAVAVPTVLFGTVVGLLAMYVSVRSGPKVALRAAKAQPVEPHDPRYRQLINVFDEVCVSAGLSGDRKPCLYVVDDPAPNAFATGIKADDAHVAVTTGLLHELPRYELRAVLAHEVAHIVNDDIRAVTVAVATAGLVAFLADVMARSMLYGGRSRSRSSSNNGGGALLLVIALIAIVLAPLAAQAIRFAVSRQREFLADATAAEMLRDPQSMVNALRRIDGNHASLERFEVATAHLWFEEPNDTRGKKGLAKLARRFATHPPMSERVARLAELNSGTVQIDATLPPSPSQMASSQPPPPPAPGADAGTPPGNVPIWDQFSGR